MSKCVFVNLNVGSAIEQTGGEILEHIKKIKDLEIGVFTDQTREDTFFKFLLNNSPDIIIVNGKYPRIIGPINFYKSIYNNTKIVFISRVTSDFHPNLNIHSEFSIFDKQRGEIFIELCDLIICNNSCGKAKYHTPQLRHKMIDLCGFNDPDKFKITTPGNQRQKDFIIFGSLHKHKVKPEFLKSLENTDISIDCYGNLSDPEILDLFENIPNLNYKGVCEFDKVPELLNEYKYTILPHDGKEPLNHSLQQCMLCGTIPLVLDDNCKNIFGDYWLHGGEDLYIPAKNETELIDLIKNKKNNENDEHISTGIREALIDRYNLNHTFHYIRHGINTLMGKSINGKSNI